MEVQWRFSGRVELRVERMSVSWGWRTSWRQTMEGVAEVRWWSWEIRRGRRVGHGSSPRKGEAVA